MLVYAFPYFLLVNTHNEYLIILATFIGLAIIWPPITATMGTMFSEAFSKEVRFTGVTLGYQIGAALAGGTAPMISEYLMALFGGSSLPVSLYIIVTAIISITAVMALRGENMQDMDDVHYDQKELA